MHANPHLVRLHSFVKQNLKDDFGHGLDHAVKVSLDAGTLMIVEGKKAGYSHELLLRRLFLVQCAGLLHDLKRKKKDHAQAGADFAKSLLQNYPLTKNEISDIYHAILNHEAFRKPVKAKNPKSALVSDCLYDADKFRWGPDNFFETVWRMVDFHRIPPGKFLEHYPDGIKKIASIKQTFRSETGQMYGPNFIDIGLLIGEKLFHFIQNEFRHK